MNQYHRLLHWLWARHDSHARCQACVIQRRLRWRGAWAEPRAQAGQPARR